MERKNLFAGLFFLVMAAGVLARDMVYYDLHNYVWFCDLSLVMFGAAFLTENVQMVKGLINIGLVAQFIYILEIVLFISLGISLSTLPSDLLSTGPVNIAVSIIIHLFSTNLALFMTYRQRTKRVALAYSASVLLLMFVLTVMFTPPDHNINYVFSSDFIFGLSIPHYIFLWLPLAFLMPVLPTYWLQASITRLSRRGPESGTAQSR